jgi:orotate phosphoribosyltransferase
MVAANTSFLDLIAGRRGHFQLESGHHSGLWFDLDALFAVPGRIAPFVDQLAELLRPYNVAAVCGPLLGGAFLAQLVAQKLEVEFYFTERRMPQGAAGLYSASYHLPTAFIPRVRSQRIAMVDDVMSAGSALRGTYTELQSHDAMPVVASALMILGNTGADFFAEQHIAVEGVIRENYLHWLPNECPHCSAGAPLENIGGIA